VNVTGEINPDTGLLIDFGDLKKIVKPYIEMLDHWCINEVGEREGIELLQNPSSENISKWLYFVLKPKLEGLYSIVVQETCTARCEFREKFD